jgi:hypothetical protein
MPPPVQLHRSFDLFCNRSGQPSPISISSTRVTLKLSGRVQWMSGSSRQQSESCRNGIESGGCLALHSLNACRSGCRHGWRDCALKPMNCTAFVQGASAHPCQSLLMPSRFLPGFPQRPRLSQWPRSSVPCGERAWPRTSRIAGRSERCCSQIVSHRGGREDPVRQRAYR